MKTQDVKYLVMKERTEAEVRGRGQRGQRCERGEGHRGRGEGQRGKKDLPATLVLPFFVSRDTSVNSHFLQKVRRLKTSLHLIGAVPEGGRKHTVFVDDAAEARAFRPEAYFGTPAELLGRTHNRPRERQLLDESLPAASGRAASKALKRTET